MFVGCSEVSVSVCKTCATYWNYQGFLVACGGGGGDLIFSLPWGQKNVLGCSLLG